MVKIALTSGITDNYRLGRFPRSHGEELFTSDGGHDGEGLLWFKFKDSPTVFQLSPIGKLEVKWNDLDEKKTLPTGKEPISRQPKRKT